MYEMVPPVRMKRKKQRNPAINLILLLTFSSFTDHHSHLFYVIKQSHLAGVISLILLLTFSSFVDDHYHFLSRSLPYLSDDHSLLCIRMHFNNNSHLAQKTSLIFLLVLLSYTDDHSHFSGIHVNNHAHLQQIIILIRLLIIEKN